MKIVAIDVCPLTGATVDGGWPQGHEPQENLHTLLVVRTDAGLVGYGSCYTSGRLVAGAVELLWPLLRGESAVEPERVSETLRQSSFWQGRGGAVEHAISGIDIALWDLMGKACGQPVSRLLGGDYRRTIKPYGSILFDEPEPLRKDARGRRRAGVPGDQAGLAAVRPPRPEVRRAAGPDRPRGGRRRRRADGRRRRQRAVLAARDELGAEHRGDARRLRRRLVRGAAAARTTSTATSR